MEETGPKTPAEELAAIVSSALVSARLIRSERLDELTSILASGKARPEDWARWIEEELDAEARDS